jgi:hypothetical protein
MSTQAKSFSDLVGVAAVTPTGARYSSTVELSAPNTEVRHVSFVGYLPALVAQP